MFKNIFFILLITILSFSSKATAEKRVALVIGNSDYIDSPLRNPVNDASDLSTALRSLNFEVITNC